MPAEILVSCNSLQNWVEPDKFFSDRVASDDGGDRQLQPCQPRPSLGMQMNEPQGDGTSLVSASCHSGTHCAVTARRCATPPKKPTRRGSSGRSASRSGGGRRPGGGRDYGDNCRVRDRRCLSIDRTCVRSIAAPRLADGLPVVIKTLNAEYPSKQNVAELRREFQITQRLQPAEGVIRVHALEVYGNGNLAIVLEPFGRSLAEQIAAQSHRRFPLDRFFTIALSLAETLARVHELDVVHKNIEPRSILIDGSDTLRLIDFGISSELSLERQQYALSNRLEGKLPYISPEQTGRMNRDLDYRSDYYSLGVTLFELLAGELPFRVIPCSSGFTAISAGYPGRRAKLIDRSQRPCRRSS